MHAHLQVVERFNGRVPGYFGQKMTPFSYIDDVVKGHVAAMMKGRPGERYLLTGENASFKHFFDVAAEITHTPKPQFRIPLLLMEALAWLWIILSTITTKPPLISPSVCMHLNLPLTIFTTIYLISCVSVCSTAGCECFKA